MKQSLGAAEEAGGLAGDLVPRQGTTEARWRCCGERRGGRCLPPPWQQAQVWVLVLRQTGIETVKGLIL